MRTYISIRTAFVAVLLLCACAAPPPASATNLEAHLAAGDPDRGRKVFRKCSACHTSVKDGRDRIGPNLWGIVGAPVAAMEGFRYSKAMVELGGRWTAERLDAYLERPRALVKGTSMSFVGLRRERDRVDVIAFLNEMSDNPLDFGPTQEASANSLLPEPENLGLMVTASGASETFDACTPCHSERIVVQQGLNREQWDELLDLMVSEQGMDSIEDDTKTVILDYLAEHYGPDRPNFPRN